MEPTIIYSILIGIITLLLIPIVNEIYQNLKYSISKDKVSEFVESMNPKSGTFVHSAVAIKDLTKFKKRRFKLFYNYKKRAYGHFFGIIRLREFLEKMEAYNETKPSIPIIGFRVYRSFKDETENKHDDVFLVPVLENKRNFPEIDKDLETVESGQHFTEEAILNTSVPCPNKCGGN